MSGSRARGTNHPPPEAAQRVMDVRRAAADRSLSRALGSSPWHLFRRAMRTVPVGCWEWNLHTDELTVDETALAVLGIEPGDFDRRLEGWAAVVHPEDLPWVLAELDGAIRERAMYNARYRVCHPGGTIVWVEAGGYVVLGADGKPVAVIGALREMSTTEVAQESIRRVLRCMGDVFLAVDDDWRITFANVEAERFLGSPVRLVGTSLWDVVPPGTADLELRLRGAVAEETPAEVELRWPTDRRWYRMRLAPAPGGLVIHITDVNDITDITDRRRKDVRRTAAEQATERTARLGELTTALADALTMQDVVNTVADRVLPPFGATGLHILSVEREHLHVVGSVGYQAEFSDRINRIPVQGKFPISEALRDRAPKFICSAEEYIALYPMLADVPASGQKNAWAFLPLIAAGHALGCAVVSFDHPRRFSREERNLLIALSGLVAQALERARLYDAAHIRAQELQRGLLPRVLPRLPAVAVAARYLPAGGDMEVGGDWYDVIPLSAGRVALVIGDVMGHGVSEAATMGRLRTAVRTLADLELPPDELLAHLNDIVSDMGDDFYATCLYMIYDPATRGCVFSRAGHPPPAIVHPGGTVCFPVAVPDPPLGAAAPPFTTVEMKQPEGTLLVLYTDGLVESPTQDIDEGMAGLAHALMAGITCGPSSGSRPAARDEACPERLCDTLADALLPSDHDATDDAALLIACTRTLAAGDVATWRLPEDAVAAGLARRYVRDKLAEWHLESLSSTTELLASELVGNVVRHAKGPIHLRMLRSNVLTCEVSDGSLTTPRIRRCHDLDEGGRGLQLVAALSHRWGTRYTTSGKSIWTEQLLPSP